MKKYLFILFLIFTISAEAKQIKVDLNKWRAGNYPRVPEKIKKEIINIDGEKGIKIEIDKINRGYISTGPKVNELNLKNCFSIELYAKVEGIPFCELNIHIMEKDYTRWQSGIFLTENWSKFVLFPEDFSWMPPHPKIKKAIIKKRLKSKVNFGNISSISFNSTIHYVKYCIYFKKFTFNIIETKDIILEIENLCKKIKDIIKEIDNKNNKDIIEKLNRIEVNKKTIKELLKIKENLYKTLWRVKFEYLFTKNRKYWKI